MTPTALPDSRPLPSLPAPAFFQRPAPPTPPATPAVAGRDQAHRPGPAAPRSPLRLACARFWCLLLFNLDFHRRNVLGLVMTVVIPLALLVFYSFVYYVSTVPPTLGVGYSADLPAPLRDRLATTRLAGVAFYQVEGSAEEVIAGGKCQLHVGYDAGRGVAVVQGKRLQRPVAEILRQNLASVPPTPAQQEAIELRAVGEGYTAMAFLPGMLLMAIMNLALFSTGGKLLEDRAQGTLRMLRTFPVPSWLLFAADLCSKFALTALLGVLFMALGTGLLNIELGLGAVALTLLVSAVSAIALIAFSFALGAVLPRYSSGIHVFTALNLFLGFLGDIIFPTSLFPMTRPLAAILPTSHCVNLLRVAMLDIAPSFPVLVSAAYLAVFTAVCCFISVRFFSFSAKY